MKRLIAIGGIFLVETCLAVASGTERSVSKGGTDKAESIKQEEEDAPLFPVPDGILTKAARGYELVLTNGQKIMFLSVPAGKFQMGFRNDKSKKLATVGITRPFWMTEDMITCDQWTKGLAQNSRCGMHEGHWREDVKAGGWWKRIYNVTNLSECGRLPVFRCPVSDINDVCRQLTARYKSLLPKGYVFRLSTNGEWQYVYKNLTDRRDEALNANACGLDRFMASISVPHKWGFKHVAGAPEWKPGGGLIVLDCLGPESLIIHKDDAKINFKSKLPPDLRQDPLWYYDGDDGWNFLANQWSVSGNVVHRWHSTFTQLKGWRAPGFRLVIGPDLVSEWKAKNGKK